MPDRPAAAFLVSLEGCCCHAVFRLLHKLFHLLHLFGFRANDILFESILFLLKFFIVLSRQNSNEFIKKSKIGKNFN